MKATASGSPHPGGRASSGGLPRQRKEQAFLPTLFDRLCDDAPHEKTEGPDAYALNRNRLRQVVLRDLQTLLNTTDISEQIDAGVYEAAAASGINYGVPPLAGGYLSEKKWGDIERLIRRAIARFEPRLLPDTLIVRPVHKDKASAHYNVLTFEISGHIHMNPYPIEFSVQSAVDLETSRIELHPR